MSKPILIIISGLPATGKTTLGHALSQELRLPFISKDELKEVLFDSLGWSDKTWSRKMSLTAFRLMDQLAAQHLASGNSLILETNFQAIHDASRLQKLVKNYSAIGVEIICYTDPELRMTRFNARLKEARRHPGHADQELKSGDDIYFSLALDKKLVVDTTDLSRLHYKEVADQVRNAYTG